VLCHVVEDHFPAHRGDAQQSGQAHCGSRPYSVDSPLAPWGIPRLTAVAAAFAAAALGAAPIATAADNERILGARQCAMAAKCLPRID
jgi:hypothetical protein